MTIWTSRNQEDSLRRQFRLNIPTFPATGPVTQDGVEVGHIDNFNGLDITSKIFGENPLGRLASHGICCVWNVNEKTPWD